MTQPSDESGSCHVWSESVEVESSPDNGWYADSAPIHDHDPLACPALVTHLRIIGRGVTTHARWAVIRSLERKQRDIENYSP